MKKNATVLPGLDTAIGLIWGLVEQRQPEQALVLLEGCRSCWPGQATLELLQQICLAACFRPAQPSMVEVFKNPEWAPVLQILKNRHFLNMAALEPKKSQGVRK
jgi:hypothetical protein